ncbi:DUF3817 domain-containing protein [Gulosibacter chungangensis]|uniref:DUF3817 domain-containing protein n=1 Tax=Gulosibacter chungangensis TaxID=979746 RepID=A0A7J5B8K2_9MICO|nr:DUF3817 domain-containing protein [Gulosibacter chungangensis]KAB1641656.1 DUF3817 domain-containing protein [Gulosibacter chungangensis]
MSRIPRPEEFPGIHARLRFYKVTAWITGILLLLLVVEMVLKYAFHLEIEMFGPFGFMALVQEGTVTAFNLSRWILIIHGWFYVVYLIASYLVWLKMRWELIWLLAMAGGGVVPFLSFITEHQMAKRAHRELAEAQLMWDARVEEDAKLAAVEDSLSAEQRAALDAEVDAEVKRRTDGE